MTVTNTRTCVLSKPNQPIIPNKSNMNTYSHMQQPKKYCKYIRSMIRFMLSQWKFTICISAIMLLQFIMNVIDGENLYIMTMFRDGCYHRN